VRASDVVDHGTPAGKAPEGRAAGSVLVPAGVGVTLVGLLGDLVSHALDTEGLAHEPIIVLGKGNNPWHLVLFLGILITAIGGIRRASRLPTEWAALMGAALILLLGSTVVAGAYVGWKERGEQHAADALAQGARRAASSSAHQHAGGAATGSSTADAAGVAVEGPAEFGGHSHGTPGPTTAAEARILEKQLADAKAATKKYRSLARAKADGYIQVTQFIPTLGMHLANLRISQMTFDPSRPQVLLYGPAAGGGWKLVGVSYALQTNSDTPPEGFAGGSDVWHFHRDLCFLLDGTVTIAPTAGDCLARHGLFQERTAWLLHVWLWQANPNGVFTEANPLVF
jgi:hypothetical protein